MGELFVRSISNDLSDVVAHTTTPLAANASFTSDPFPCKGWGKVVGTLYADQDGTLRVQFRNDGTNWDGEETIAYTAGTRLNIEVPVHGDEARVVYDNGAVAQTTFRLYLRLRRI